jgi:DNA-binding beta-propeller fold protein YncE
MGTDWKRAVVLSLSLAVLSLAACGGGNATPSGVVARAFVSDDLDGTLHIEDARDDLESPSRITTGSKPGTMALSPDKLITLVFDSGDNSLAVVANYAESVLGRITLPTNICPATPPTPCLGYVSLSGDIVGLVAVPNCPPAACNGNPGVASFVEVLDLPTITNSAGTLTGFVPVANVARTLVLSPIQSKLLVLSGAGDSEDTLTVIDTATAQTSPATAATTIAGFDHPVWAVFSSDGTKAYIFNCGPECGGSTSSISALDMTASPPAVVTTVPVPAASTGLLSGSTLFVAGTPSGTHGAFAGALSVLNTSPTLAVTSSVPISDGFHNHMELASNNQLFIGAMNCMSGCLTMFDTSKSTAAVDPNTGNVTGIAPIPGRTVVYVVEDLLQGSQQCLGLLPCVGELVIYDTLTDAPTPEPDQIDVVGRAVDVKFVF